MSAHAVTCVNHLVDEFRRFMRTSYHLADPHLRAQFESHVDEADVLVKGPYVTLAQDFLAGRRLREIASDKRLYSLNWPFGDNPLYTHQEQAFIKADQEDRNVVIKTGTGSGKTEAFLLVVLAGVLKLRDKGVEGTKAILLYPMNALVNDQLKRLRDLIRDTGVSATFAMYTGESERVAHTLGEPLEGNELIQRAHIRKTPPDIILTNYKELEFMLVRNDDRSIFTEALHYFVLDEIHSYRGALATEIACLIRRLKARCGLDKGALRCIGTSATVSEGAGGDKGLVSFVTGLFGEKFESTDIVGEILVERKESDSSYIPPFPKLDKVTLTDFDVEDEANVAELAEYVTGKDLPPEGSLTGRISATLQGNEVIALLEESCSSPQSITELADKLAERFTAAAELSKEERQTLVEVYLLLGSIGTEDDPPILRPKLHTFFHGVYDVGLCMNPSCRFLVKDGSDECPKCHSTVRPAALCRTCGQDFVKVRFPEEGDGPPVANDSFRSDESTGFITPKVHIESDEEDSEDNSDKEDVTGRSHGRRRETAARARLLPKWVCHACGMVHDDEVEACENCGVRGSVTEQLVMRGKGNTCPVCNSTYTRGDIITLLRSGAASTTSLLATHHLDRLKGDDRKLLVFSDNRQEAAHQAGYMNDRHRQFAIRHAIERIARESPNGVSMPDVPELLLTQFQHMGLTRKRLTRDEKTKWIYTLQFEAAGEFCRATHQRISLENLALVEVQYEFLQDLKREKNFVEICKESEIETETGLRLVRAILDKIRRSRAVDFPFFQEYIDPSRDKWAMLQQDPYNLAVPERERGPVFFMLDRSESARNSVGGYRFQAFVKDSPRGGISAIPKIVQRAGINETTRDKWIREVVRLLQQLEILVTPERLPPRVRTAIGGGRPLQIASRVMRLVPANLGYRCQRCRIWHPFKGEACYSTKCTGLASDLKEEQADPDHYYVRLYTANAPRRMLAAEHTAQIDADQRAKREKAFAQEGSLDVLVCSPTLELGVDIGPLMTLMLRNCPPVPANYIQRAGRAGRRLRIGFVSTFCGMGSHDRHCFEDPAWLVRGDFFPPSVRLTSGLVVARHIRSFVFERILEGLSPEYTFPGMMSEFVDDLDSPGALDLSRIEPALVEIKNSEAELVKEASTVFTLEDNGGDFVSDVISAMPAEIRRTLNNWFRQIQRVYQEFEYYRKITADRRAKQKASARERAYRELTVDRRHAYVLNFLSNDGFLPSYQFPTDTFNLDPGVQDTPTLYRPAWIALFEFAPGNLVYANGHKLKSIRAFFEGQSRLTSGDSGSLEASGRVRSFCFCDTCGFASEEVRNDCPRCKTSISKVMDVAFIESYEAEESTQITAAEEGRERTYFQRKESLLQTEDSSIIVYPYQFCHLELCRHSKIFVTNWGKRASFDTEGERFLLCHTCGKHRSSTLTDKQVRKWDEEHAKRCSGEVKEFILGYEFLADALVLAVPKHLLALSDRETFGRTMGTSLVRGAMELIEIEPDELAFFHQPAGDEGMEIIFYETAPGGAGYLTTLANNLLDWARLSIQRLQGHGCAKACYRCLKSYRNQPFHEQLDKTAVIDALFQLSCGKMTKEPHGAKRNDALKLSEQWLVKNTSVPTENTVIEQKLAEAMKNAGRLPEPVAQREFKDGDRLVTVADFAYEKEKIAIYCDGFAYHGDKETLAKDAQKRNFVQSQGWSVLTFWGKTILTHPERCEEQIWQVYRTRKL